MVGQGDGHLPTVLPRRTSIGAEQAAAACSRSRASAKKPDEVLILYRILWQTVSGQVESIDRQDARNCLCA